VQRGAESLSGNDLSTVRVHDDAEAADLSNAVGAEAFTYGRDIFFGAGRHDPTSKQGLALLGHELGHVVGAGGSPGGASVQRLARDVDVVEEGSPTEQAADDFGAKVAGSADPAGASVQRECGCGGSCGGCGDGAEAAEPDKAEPGKAVQRQPLPSSPRPVIQRKILTFPLGATTVTMVPSASVQLPARNVTRTFEAAPNEVVPLQAGETDGRVNMLTNVSWQGQGGGPGPGPGPKPAPNPSKCALIQPQDAKDVCLATEGACDQIVDPKTKAGCEIVKDPAKFRKMSSTQLCGILALFALVPVLTIPIGTLCGVCLLGSGIGKLLGLGDPCSALLNFIIDSIIKLFGGKPDQPGPQPGPQPATPAQGSGRVELRTRFHITEDGTFQLVGPDAISTSSGSGARLVAPAQFGRQPFQGGASMNIMPTVAQDGAGQAQEAFELELAQPAPPAPNNVSCSDVFEPFKTGKDQFENEPRMQKRMFAFFNGLHPALRRKVEDGTIPIKVIGRASRLGSFDTNLKLSKKRAQRVAEIFQGMSGGNMKVTFVGELEATGPTENAETDRNAEVIIQGQLTGRDAAELGTAFPCNTSIGGGAGPGGAQLQPGQQTVPDQSSGAIVAPKSDVLDLDSDPAGLSAGAAGPGGGFVDPFAGAQAGGTSDPALDQLANQIAAAASGGGAAPKGGAELQDAFS